MLSLIFGKSLKYKLKKIQIEKLNSAKSILPDTFLLIFSITMDYTVVMEIYIAKKLTKKILLAFITKKKIV